MTPQAKEAFCVFTRLESTCAHVARSLAQYSIPVKNNDLVEKRYPKINLEIMVAPMAMAMTMVTAMVMTMASAVVAMEATGTTAMATVMEKE